MSAKATGSKEPEVATRRTLSEQSSTALLDHNSSKHEQGLGGQAKNLWQKLKDEDGERKEKQVQHVSHAEATKITGYGENGSKSNVNANKGDKRSLGALFFG